ncbi:uncharacterized protein isoform X2 [Leptinotarsa decemlineata]|uniref:uncharacterized protein isoform X2 n=1 Tax=Leptinotarsa decemlineata TaxID=7539 RepID=UPI003D308D09
MAAQFGIQSEFNPDVHDFDIFIRKLKSFFVANAIVNEERKRAILLNALSENAFVLLENLALPAKPENISFDDIVKLFETYYKPTRVVFAERFAFYATKKWDSETIQEYAVRLRGLATHCKFGTSLDNALRDKFICGFEKGKILDMFFTKDEHLTFQEAIQAATATDVANHSYRLPATVQVKGENIYKLDYQEVKDQRTGYRSGPRNREQSSRGQTTRFRRADTSNTNTSSGSSWRQTGVFYASSSKIQRIHRTEVQRSIRFTEILCKLSI